MRYLSVASIFNVKDLEVAIGFYTTGLGFEIDFMIDDYIGVKKDGMVFLHLTSNKFRADRTGRGHIYIVLDEVDSYYAAIRARGLQPLSSPANLEYGMREFETTDPDGNILTFGCQVPSRFD
ncbi:Bleomycin resistance protein [Dyadobacter sp. CECT 9275]|uniref:Bleomycin resistance protein n=1 Tax=Dyadobacter helix TaxID=2822344 RepID=A0A916JHH1_9BACT|nr:VOC family protein [Dyadobacter sp. CECT 9275]CAG5007663.1 Bleomycin resistance protein [Dyadobacter sp. CECT 9275]